MVLGIAEARGPPVHPMGRFKGIWCFVNLLEVSLQIRLFSLIGLFFFDEEQALGYFHEERPCGRV